MQTSFEAVGFLILKSTNDCGENQRMFTELPDWLTARWIIEIEDGECLDGFFSQFLEFVSKEAKLACNPGTSLHALKSWDDEQMRILNTFLLP